MSAPHIRATDREEFTRAKRRDFVVRKHGLTSKQLYTLCFATVLVIVGVGVIVYSNSMASSLICAVVGLILLIIAKQDEKNQKLLHGTEFLNALFASALGAGHKFCMIAKQDGEIVYLDRSFQQMFPEIVERPRRLLDNLMITYHVPESQAQQVMNAITLDTESTINIQIEGGRDRTVHSIAMHIEPIMRPSGFCLVRGRVV